VSNSAVATFERQRTARLRRERRRAGVVGMVFLAALMVAAHVGEVELAAFIDGIPGFANYFMDIAPVLRPDHLFTDLCEWYWAIDRWLLLLWDTVLIAFLGTVLGGIGGLVLSFPAAHNLSPSRSIYFFTRRFLELARAVPELVYAMMFVFAFGIGPFAGVLAIAIHTMGALGKLFAEVNENADFAPLDGVRAAGANWAQSMRLAVLPQVLPNMASYALLRFEINVRGAAVIGIVGAGGIGQELLFVIRQFIYADISAIVLMIIVTVSLIDIGCERLRHRLIGQETLA